MRGDEIIWSSSSTFKKSFLIWIFLAIQFSITLAIMLLAIRDQFDSSEVILWFSLCACIVTIPPLIVYFNFRIKNQIKKIVIGTNEIQISGSSETITLYRDQIKELKLYRNIDNRGFVQLLSHHWYSITLTDGEIIRSNSYLLNFDDLISRLNVNLKPKIVHQTVPFMKH